MSRPPNHYHGAPCIRHGDGVLRYKISDVCVRCAHESSTAHRNAGGAQGRFYMGVCELHGHNVRFYVNRRTCVACTVSNGRKKKPKANPKTVVDNYMDFMRR